MTTTYQQQTRASQHTIKNREALYQLFQSSPLPLNEMLVNLGLYMRSGSLARILFLNEMYQKIVSVPGCIMEFGTWWGQTLVLMENLRAVHEPYNYVRNIIGFDSFCGYPAIGKEDKSSETIKIGGYATTSDYNDYLASLIAYHESENTMGHIKKHSLVKGDITQSVPDYFSNHPETIIALAIFDLALYEPTKIALRHVMKHVVKGSVIVLDEFNSPDYPGETRAVIEEVGLTRYRMVNSTILPDRTYFVVD